MWPLEGKGSARKLRLYAVACVLRVLGLLPSKTHQRAVEVAERYADGLADTSELAVACEQARNAHRGSSPVSNAQRASVSTSDPGDAFEVASWTRHFAALAAGGTTCAESPAELRAQGRLLRCIFGNPFRPGVAVGTSVEEVGMPVALAAAGVRVTGFLQAADSRRSPRGGRLHRR